MNLHKYTQDLANFYTQSAYKRHHTRRRDWPEFNHIASYINMIDLDYLTVLEVGCGDGRLYKYLVEHCPNKTLRYVWVDVSQWLIDLANEHYSDATRVCDEMNNYLELIPQQSCDIVIAIASIQHLPTRKDQSLFFHEAYRILNYDGSLIMTNWSLSQWFIKRYWRPLLMSISKSIATLWYSDWRDVMVPFTDDNSTSYRFYHIFSKRRLTNLLRLAGFAIVKAIYSTSWWWLTHDWKISRNHYHIARKQVRLD